MTHEHRDRDVVVDRGGGTSVGLIVGIILAVLIVLALVWYFGMGGFNGGGAGQEQMQQEQNIEVAPPADGGAGDQGAEGQPGGDGQPGGGGGDAPAAP